MDDRGSPFRPIVPYEGGLIMVEAAGNPGRGEQIEGLGWSPAGRAIVSALLGFHLVAMLVIALAGAPSSELERSVAGPFRPYATAIAQDHVYRFYAPAPPPTPIVTARVEFGGDRPTIERRLPDRSLRPRLRYQRELALANHLANDHARARNAAGGPRPSLWGASYGRHLLATSPGATRVTILLQQHRVPDLVLLRSEGGRAPINPDDPAFYTVPEIVGEYSARGRPDRD
jgi:hypothetical protein